MESDFIKNCLKTFGKTPHHINYMLEDLEHRMTHIEKHIEKNDPVMGANIATVEAIKNTLNNKNIIGVEDINSEVTNVLNKQNKINLKGS